MAIRPDLNVQPLRGNVNTRLGRLDDGEYDAIVLACAGLERLGLGDRISEQFSFEQMLPAAGQGVVGIECLQGRDELKAVLLDVEHAQTRTTTVAERAIARRLGASCQSPVASFATMESDELYLRALVANADGSIVIRDKIRGQPSEAESLGNRLADQLLEQGAGDLLRELAE
jgi:hydroxymethylbilane synthase